MEILVAIAGHPHLEATVRIARQLAAPTGARLVILNVIEREALRQGSTDILVDARQELEGLAVDTKTVVGVAGDEILREARRGAYDLVILGAHERPSLVEYFLGSVARKVVDQSPTSVLVVQGKRDHLTRFLICTGGKHYAEPAIEEGIRLARATGARVTLLYVTMPPATMFTGLEEVDEQLAELLQTDTPEARHLRRAAQIMQEAGVVGELKLRHGAVVNEILREAKLGDYDLIVMGAPIPRGLFTAYLWGNVTGQVLQRAMCPVLVVRNVDG